jgi:AcrR family transcriptional regulator
MSTPAPKPTPIAASPTPRLPAPARREQLLDVTSAIVTEQGFQAISIESVARRAGISRPIVYDHFDDLPGLLHALVEREMTNAHAQIAETELHDLSEGDPLALMLDSLRKYLAAVERHPTTWRLVLTPPEGAPELLRRSIRRGRATVLRSLIDAVRPVLKPTDDGPDPELTARLLSAIADEYARLVLTDPERFPPERLLTHARWCLSHIGSAD